MTKERGKALPGKCLTTAMGILPHTDLEEGMKQALSLDIAFWPQLPKYSFYEDMYVQSSEGFPGITVDDKAQRVIFETEKFYQELPDYFEKSTADPDFFELTPAYSVAFRDFLSRDLSGFPIIRGQSVGPVSFGLKILDENRKSIAYNDEIREFLFDFFAQKFNAQYRQMAAVHPNALVWMDEPGLQMLFTSVTGYTDAAAAADYRNYLDQIEGPRGIHLCGNPDWSFLLRELDLDIISMDGYTQGQVFTRYKDEVVQFIKDGGIIAWGITPTLTEELDIENVNSLIKRLEEMFAFVSKSGVDMDELLDRAWLAPSRCCLVNADGTKSVDQSFEILRTISEHFKEKYHLY